MEGKRRGFGDLLEKMLNFVGITKERVAKWIKVDDCGCEKRKDWLNKIFRKK